jgi:hypothetical protein
MDEQVFIGYTIFELSDQRNSAFAGIISDPRA